MLEQSLSFFVNWFSNPSFGAMALAVGIGLIWYAMYVPPVRGYAFVWAIAAATQPCSHCWPSSSSRCR